METILYLATVDTNGNLSRTAKEALTSAVNLKEQLGEANLAIGLIGGNVQLAANSIADCGASNWYAVSGASFAESRYCSDIEAATALVKTSGATIVIAPAGSRTSRMLPGTAYRSGGQIDTRITALSATAGSISVERWYYRQRMLAQLTREQRPWFLVLEGGTAVAYDKAPGNINLEQIPVELADTSLRTEVIGTEAPAADAQTIRPDAELLFVAGAGWTKKQADGQPHVKEAEELIRSFLTKSKASLGSSKSLVDQSGEGQEVISFMTHLNQVGQTGTTPRHPKGLSTCCHGEEPHVVGWRFITERRAINTDPNCSWAHGKTDVLYVADAFAVINKVNELLS